jgi:hypothetical protein
MMKLHGMTGRRIAILQHGGEVRAKSRVLCHRKMYFS